MYAKAISYTDLDDVKVTDTCYFNMTKTELMEYVGGSVEIGHIDAENEEEMTAAAQKKLLRKLEFKTGAEIIAFIKDLVLRSYGERSEDGKRFIKTRPDGSKLADDFIQSLAYDALITELTDNPEKADQFLFAIMPSAIANKVKAKRDEETKEATTVIDVMATPVT